MTNSETFASCLIKELETLGVQYLFGVPSGPWTVFMDAIQESEMEFILVTNEASAAFMADVCGRITGVPGVCYATFGPGATNLSTGIANALLDRSPVIALTSEVKSSMKKRITQMNIDHQALYAPITKWTTSFDSRNLNETLDKAATIACQEPPGPVHLGIPEELGPGLFHRGGKLSHKQTRIDPIEKKAVALIRQKMLTAKKPIVVIGLSAIRSGVQQEIKSFVEKYQLPVVLTPMAKGLLSEEHPLYVGVLFHALSDLVAETHSQADLVISIGYDPVEFNYEEWMPRAPLIHIDTQPADVITECALWEIIGDIALTVRAINQFEEMSFDWNIEEVQQRTLHMFQKLRPIPGMFSPRFVLHELQKQIPKDSIMTCDVGAHTHLIGQAWKTWETGTCLMTNGGSSMGFGIPAAIAAKLCKLEKAVVCITGDGGFMMMVGEMATAKRLGLPIIFIVLRDHNLQLIKIKQQRKGFIEYGIRLEEQTQKSSEQFFGVPVLAAHSENEFSGALTNALNADGPIIIEAFVDPKEYDELIMRPHKT